MGCWPIRVTALAVLTSIAFAINGVVRSFSSRKRLFWMWQSFILKLSGMVVRISEQLAGRCTLILRLSPFGIQAFFLPYILNVIAVTYLQL